MTISGNVEHFKYFNFETDFLENENLFLEYRFLNESINIENASFRYYTPIPEADVKAIVNVTVLEWCVQSGPVTKKVVVPVTTLYF